MFGRPLVARVILQAKGAGLRRVVQPIEDWVFAKEGHGCIAGDRIVVRGEEEHLVARADIHGECLVTELLQVHQVLGCERARTVQVAWRTSRTSATAQHAIGFRIPAFFRSSMETGGQNIRLHLIEEQCTEQRRSGRVRTTSMTGETPW